MSHIAGYRVSDHITCQRIVGIPPDIILFQPDTFDPVRGIFHRGLKFFHFVLGQLLLQYHIMTVRVFLHDPVQFGPILSKIINQRLQGRFHAVFGGIVAVIFPEHTRIQYQIIYFLTGGKNSSVAVINISPFIGKRNTVRILLRKHLHGILVSADPVNIDQTYHDTHQRQNYNGKRQRQLSLDLQCYLFSFRYTSSICSHLMLLSVFWLFSKYLICQ